MKSDRLIKILLVGFVLALAIYISFFSLIQYRRTYRGPWQAQFSTDATGTPGILITQSKFNISKTLLFPENKVQFSNTTRTVIFDNPTKIEVPFGEVVFQDLTFLPGTVTFNFFGHEIEFLPRILIIDKQEYDWKTGEVITVAGPRKFTPHQRK